MLELVAMVNVKKRKPSFTIVPIFLGLSLSQCRDVHNRRRWLSMWQSWAKCDSQIDLIDWVDALQVFGPTNALKYNIELGEVKFREEIVEVICRLIPPGTRFEDSYIQGRSCLCKVIYERMMQSKISSQYGVHVIGLHGFGGIGKTTLCKAMCNYVSKEFCGKVAQMELESRSEEELLSDVLRRLTNMNLECLGALNVDEYRFHFKQDMMNVKVFLTIDNVSSATRRQALIILRAKYGLGSVLLVTTHSLTDLESLGILSSESIKMPELNMEEARSLFIHHAACVPSTYLSNKNDYELVLSCVQRCHFKKGDAVSYHYHPLALQVLGEQLASNGYDVEEWRLRLHEADFLNPFGEPQHPVFSILRKSFDSLNPQDQLLFMDVALFVPYIDPSFKWSVFEWLGMVHGLPVTSVKIQLGNLKQKSLLENIGDGFGRICLHDLWREFAKLEAKVGKFEIEKKQWMYNWNGSNAYEDACLLNGGCLVNMRRMCIIEKKPMKLQDVIFSCFPNVVVLKFRTKGLCVQKLDLSSLKHLKCLELDNIKVLGFDLLRFGVTLHPIGLGSLLKLAFFKWSNIPSRSPCMNEIGHLTNLQVLELFACGRAPNLSNLILLRVARFRYNDLVATIIGLSCKHTNLQFLDLSYCTTLKSCPSVGELVALQELRLHGCMDLQELPNLQKLQQLRRLNLSCCKSLQGLPGLGDLVNLVELYASKCYALTRFPNMHDLKNLRILDISSCELYGPLSGLNEFVSVWYPQHWGPRIT